MMANKSVLATINTNTPYEIRLPYEILREHKTQIINIFLLGGKF